MSAIAFTLNYVKTTKLRKMNHTFITRFSYRRQSFRDRRFIFSRKPDPLKAANMELRLKIFEMICFPTVINQTEKNFKWAIVVDEDIAPQHLERLNTIIAKHDTIFIRRYQSDKKLASLEWITGKENQQFDVSITTNIDSDDGIPYRYVEVLHSRIKDSVNLDGIPTIKLMGAKDQIQWDLFRQESARLGRATKVKAPVSPASCGFSLVSGNSTNCNVMLLYHNRAERYFDTISKPLDLCDKHELEVRRGLNIGESRTTNIKRGDFFYNMSKDIGPVLQSNHFNNLTQIRLYMDKKDSFAVKKEGKISGFSIRWDLVEEYMKWTESSTRARTKYYFLSRISSIPLIGKLLFIRSRTRNKIRSLFR